MPDQSMGINLSFTADAGQARQQIEQLQQSLSGLINFTSSKGKGGFGLTKELAQASSVAAQLKVQLQDATNVKTGKLDLSRFVEGMNKSNMSLKQYQEYLAKLGPEGDRAFAQLSRSITQAEIPLKRTNTVLNNFATTLKNTAKWQISSSILHGFMGSISAAYGYAKDLDSSLNNIRIVTGQSKEQMAAFAEEANKSAKALNTTTTKYTDAALIFYQQGLSDDLVKERTDTVIKMANVSREGATEVSSYMTAIWNNFNKDGTESAEHFADVMTKLGATTAASTAEIAGGLEKFASIADAIGLSFDYASSILATIVDKTRQSEDVVGTALKTIFARVQGLKLGETLEDNVDLNKYSSALKAVGVEVLDATGNLREADDILDATAEKWETLSEAQQVALAQTVAGVRQYNQFVAMMDNWDAVKENLNTARNADGTLQEQADIYAESWEAAEKRVRAAAESIYTDLINDDFFIGLSNAIAGVLEGIDKIIDVAGGLPVVLSAIGLAATKIFGKDISSAIDNTAYSLKMLFNKDEVRQSLLAQRDEINQLIMAQSADTGTDSGAVAADMYKQQALAQSELINNQERMSVNEQQRVQQLMDQQVALGEQAIEAAKLAEQREQEAKRNLEDQFDVFRTDPNIANPDQYEATFARIKQNYDELAQRAREAQQDIVDLQKIDNADELLNSLKRIAEEEKIGTREAEALRTALNNIDMNNSNAEQELRQLADGLRDNTILSNEMTQQMRNNAQAFSDVTGNMEEARQAAAHINTDLRSNIDAIRNSVTATDNVSTATSEMIELIQNAQGEQLTLGQTFTTVAESAAGLATGLISVGAALSVITDENSSGMEKVIAAVMGIGTGVTMILPAVQKLKSETVALGVAQNIFGVSMEAIQGKMTRYIASVIEGATAEEQMAVAERLLRITTIDRTRSVVESTEAEALRAVATRLNIQGIEEMTAAQLKQAIQQRLLTASTWELVRAQLALIATSPQFLAIAAAVGVLTAALIGLNLALKAQEERSVEHRLSKTKKEAEELSSQLDKAKQAADDLRASFDKYDSAVEKLKECTRGTEEWREALLTANGAALDLLTTYPELADYVTETADGMIEISKAGRDKQFESTNATLLNSQSAVNFKNAQVRDLQAENELKQAWKNSSFYGNSNAKGFAQDEIDKIYKAAVEGSLDYVTTSDQLARALGMEEFSTQIAELTPAINALKLRIEQNSKITDLGNKSITEALLKDKNYREDAKQSGNTIYTAAQQKAYDDAINALTGDYIREGGDQGKTFAKSLFEQYAADYGLDPNSYLGYSKSSGLRYKDNDGNEQTLTKDMLASYAAVLSANEQFITSMDILSNSFTQLEAAADDASIGLKNFLQEHGIAGLTKEQVDALKTSSKDNAREFLGSNFGNKDGYLSEDEAIAAGYSTAQEFVQAFINGIQDYDSQVEAIGERLYKLYGDALKPVYDKIDKSGLTLGQQSDISKYLESAFRNLGSSGAEMVAKMYEDASAAGQEDLFAEALSSVDDWQSMTVQKFRETLQEAGVSIDWTSDQLYDFIGAIKETGDAAADAARRMAENNFNEIEKLKSNLQGDNSFTDDEKDSFLKYMPEAEDWFQKMADGSNRYIGDIESAIERLNNLQVDGFIDAVDHLEQVKDKISKWEGQTFEESGLSGNAVSRDVQWNGLQKEYIDTVDTNKVQDQMDYVNTMRNAGKTDEVTNANIDTLNNEILQDTFDFDDGVKLNQIVQELASEFGNLQAAIESNSQELATATEQALSAATSYDQLQAIIAQLGGVTQDQYGVALMGLATQYDNCANEMAAYEMAVRSGDEAQKDLARDMLESSVAAGEAAKQVGATGEEMEDLARSFQDAAEAQGEEYAAINGTASAAMDAAVRYKKLNNAVEDLASNYKEYADVLKNVQKASNQNEKALEANVPAAQKLRKSIADLLNTSEDFIDANLLDAINPQDFLAAANGDEAAIARISDAFMVAQMEAANLGDMAGQLRDELAGLSEGQVIDIDNSPALMALLEAKVAAGATAPEIESLLSGLQIDCDATPFYGTLEEAAALSAATGDTIISNLSFDAEANTMTATSTGVEKDVGYSENVTVAQIGGTMTVPEDANSAPQTYPTTVPQYTKTVSVNPVEEEVSTDTPVTGVRLHNAHKSAGGHVASSNKGRANSGGGRRGGGRRGGGGRAAKNNAASRPHDELPRHSYEKKQIDSLNRSYEKINKAKNAAFGKNKAKLINEEMAALDKLHKKTKDYAELLKQDLSKDLAKLLTGGLAYYTDPETGIEHQFDASMEAIKQMTKERLGIEVELEFDEEGQIINEDYIYDIIQQLKQANVDLFNTFTTEDTDAKFNYESTNGIIEAFEQLIKRYQETTEELIENEETIADQLAQYHDMNYEKIINRVSDKITILNNGISMLDYSISLLDDNFYKTADSLLKISQKNAWLDKMPGVLRDEMAALDAALNNPDETARIDEAKYIEGLQSIFDEAISRGEDLLSNFHEIADAYLGMIDRVDSVLGDYNEHLKYYISKMDIYGEILELTGKINNSSYMETYYDGLSKLQAAQFRNAKANFDLYDRQLASWEKSIKSHFGLTVEQILKSSDANILADWSANWREEWLKLQKLRDDAELEYLEKTLDRIKTAKELLDKTTDEAGKKYEKLVTSLNDGQIGLGFDVLNDSIDLAAEKADMYLTKTNQIYNMNKLLNNISQDMDKTNNAAAKQKYAAFAKEIEQLKEKDQLSQLELDIAEAKYKLLQAQMALEDARNAKTTVRLQRDSEGNFGYVYTADRDNINKAEQDLMDAENDLYNIGLNAANEYNQKRLDLNEEYTEKFKALIEARNNGEIASEEEFNRKKEKLLQEYLEKRGEYEDRVTEATGAHANVEKDIWTGAFDYLLNKNDDWWESTQDYLNKADEAWKDSEQTIEDCLEEAGLSLDDFGDDLNDSEDDVEDLRDAIDRLADDSDKYADLIYNHISPALENQMNHVKDLSASYKDMREEILATAKAMEEIANQAKTKIEVQAGYQGFDDSIDYSVIMSVYKEALEAQGKDWKLDPYMQKLLQQREAKIDYHLALDPNYQYGGVRGWAIFEKMENDKEWYNNNIASFYKSHGEFTENGKDTLNYVATIANGIGSNVMFDSDAVNLDTLRQNASANLSKNSTNSNTNDPLSKKIDTSQGIANSQITTKNISDTIVSKLNEFSNKAQSSLSANLTEKINSISAKIPSYSQDTINQNVQIDASFPNVVNSNEIETAFKNLISKDLTNSITQYKGRKLV